MDKKKLNPKNDKYLFYIIFSIIFAYIIFNINNVWNQLISLLSIASPFYIAIALAFLLNIPMRNIERLLNKFIPKIKKEFTRALAITITLILFFIIILLFSSFIIPKIGDSVTLIFKSLNSYAIRLSRFINNVSSNLNLNYTLSVTQITNFFDSINLVMILETVADFTGTNTTNVSNIVNTVSGTTMTMLTAFFMSLYLLSNKEKHVIQFRKIIMFIFSENRGVRILQISEEATHYFNSFITGAVLEATIFMTLVYIILRLFSIPFPELIGICAFIFSFIPMFGSFITLCIGSILVAAASSDQLILFIILFVCIQQFEGNVVYPRVVGRSVGIGGLYVLLGVTVFGRLFGLLGVITGVPLTALIYAIFSRMIDISLFRKHIDVKYKSIDRLDENGNKKGSLY